MIGDKGYAGRQFEADAAALGATILRPRRKDETGRGPHLAPIRQRIESIYWSAKDSSPSSATAPAPCTASGPHRQPPPHLAAAISLNHQLGRPSRSLVAYTA